MTTQTSRPLGEVTTEGPPGDVRNEDSPSVHERAAEVGSTAKDEAAGVAQEVKQQTRDLVGEARGQVREQVTGQKNRVMDLLREVADDFEQMADQSSGVAGDLARQAAGRVRGVQGYLDGDVDPLGDLRSFARRRPGTFLLGSLALGVVAGRATRGAAAARKQQAEQQNLTTGSTRYAGEYRGPADAGYASGGYAGDTGYAQSTGYAQPGYAQPGYATQPGYGQQTGYTGQQTGYTGQQAGYGQQTGYAEETGYAGSGTSTPEYSGGLGAPGEQFPPAAQPVQTSGPVTGTGYTGSAAGLEYPVAGQAEPGYTEQVPPADQDRDRA